MLKVVALDPYSDCKPGDVMLPKPFGLLMPIEATDQRVVINRTEYRV